MTEITGKVRKILSQDLWYHGTMYKNWNSFCKNGIIVDYNKDTSDALDFGYGFYLAPSKERAENYIMRMIENTKFYSPDDIPMILCFEFVPLKWFESEKYKTRILNKYDDDFSNFVFDNRMYNIAGARQHKYDVIYGVMSDSIPTKIIIEHKIGLKTKEEVLDCLKKPTSMKQISLHNSIICDTIPLKQAYIIDRKTLERRELDINDYRKQ